jgi:hypothetical protein
LAKALNIFIQFLAQARDLIFADPLYSQRLHEIIDPSGRNTVNGGFLYNRDQGSLSPPPWFE